MSQHATIQYEVDLSDARQTRTFVLRFSSCVSFDDGLAPVRSQTWRCSLPDPNTYIEESIGTSEVRGIVGGVSEPVLAAQSEAIERALGDALVLSFSQILDLQPDVSMVLVRGPVFPKTLGRFLSLRPSETLTLAWIMSLSESNSYPIPFLFPLTWYDERSLAWDSESLINSFTHPVTEPRWAVEFINSRDNEAAIRGIKEVLDYCGFGPAKVPRDFWCAERMLSAVDRSDYVLTGDNREKRCPLWLERALTTREGPVRAPTMEDQVVGHARDFVIFPWKGNGQE